MSMKIHFHCKCGCKFDSDEYRREKSYNHESKEAQYAFVSYCPRCGRMARKKV